MSTTGNQTAFQFGLHDYDLLCAVLGIASIGINWGDFSLLIGTECIDAIDKDGKLREIGEFIVKFFPRQKKFTFENITRTPMRQSPELDQPTVSTGYFHHPHINEDGVMCISNGNSEIMLAMADGVFSKAMKMIMPALRMDMRFVRRDTAYMELVLWPLKSEVQK